MHAGPWWEPAGRKQTGECPAAAEAGTEDSRHEGPAASEGWRSFSYLLKFTQTGEFSLVPWNCVDWPRPAENTARGWMQTPPACPLPVEKAGP